MMAQTITNGEELAAIVTDDALQTRRTQGEMISVEFQFVKLTRTEIENLVKVADFVEKAVLQAVTFETEAIANDMLDAVAQCSKLKMLVLCWADYFGMGKFLSPAKRHPLSRMLVAVSFDRAEIPPPTVVAIAKALQYTNVLKLLKVSSRHADETDLTPIILTQHCLDELNLSEFSLTESELFALYIQTKNNTSISYKALGICLCGENQNYSERFTKLGAVIAENSAINAVKLFLDDIDTDDNSVIQYLENVVSFNLNY